jgi:hypothetical protein
MAEENLSKTPLAFPMGIIAFHLRTEHFVHVGHEFSSLSVVRRFSGRGAVVGGKEPPKAKGNHGCACEQNRAQNQRATLESGAIMNVRFYVQKFHGTDHGKMAKCGGVDEIAKCNTDYHGLIEQRSSNWSSQIAYAGTTLFQWVGGRDAPAGILGALCPCLLRYAAPVPI